MEKPIQQFRPTPQGEIPIYLPMYRGIHLCSRLFTRTFRQAISENSTTLANIVDAMNNNLEYSMHSVQLEENKLFN